MRRTTAAVVGLLCLGTGEALAMPAPGPLRFIAPTPAQGKLLSAASVQLRLDAACTFDTGTLAVTLNGATVPAGLFLPFSACAGSRMTSQTATVALSPPNGTITGGPTSFDVGDGVSFTGTGTGNGLIWNFDGGAEPTTGSSAAVAFSAAGQFTVRLRATATQSAAASGLDGGNLVTAQRQFDAGDTTPDTRAVTSRMPPDVDFRNYESSHVHPVALSTARDELYVVNTPEARLAIFDVDPNGALTFAGDVPVGLDPVSLAVRTGTNEVWVANHLSDTVSVVDVAARKLVATIDVGDEPTDVVFASGRAFVSLSGNQDRVRVYNAGTRQLLTTVAIPGDEPRALAANAAGTEVYVVVLESGNQTTTLFEALVGAGGGLPTPTPPRTAPGPAPDVGLIVQFDPATGDWLDETGDDWGNFIDFTLADSDLFVIDADASTPSVVDSVSGVGTILFDVAAQPGTGDLFVPNTDARNVVRFEPKLRGHLVETRVSIVDPAGSGSVSPVDVNGHINYTVSPGPPSEIALSLAHPGDGVFNAAGSRYYLTAFGSAKVGVLDGGGAVLERIDVGGGPSGVALNEPVDRLYVLNAFENTISTVDTDANGEIAVIGVAGPSEFDPSPDVIKEGRKFLYDGQLTSGHGDTACATCHVFSNFDKLAWDLGHPQGEFVDYDDAPWVTFFPLGPSTAGFDPMKGPMTTQTLRGLLDMEPFHWRGDRADFQAFNPAFVGLMGRATPLSAADMDAYTDFIMTVSFPPNPFRNLDDTMPNGITVPNQSGGGATTTGNPNTGANLFLNNPLDAGAIACNFCHLIPTGTRNTLFNGAMEGESQDFKIPHLRNMYEKVGFDVIRPSLQSGDPNNIGLTGQRAGFGFLHDGSLSLTEFLAASVFTMSTQQERDMFAFMIAFPVDSPPTIGHQVTVTPSTKNDSTLITRINTLVAQANASNSDLIAKGVVGGTTKGFVYDTATGNFVPDSTVESPISESALRASLTGGDVLTYTGVPPGAGVRLGIDRDRDTFLDRTETTHGLDPADPHSNPWQF